MNNQTVTIVPNPDVAFTQVDEDVVFLKPELNHFFGVNFMGAEIWNLVNAKESTIESVCKYITEHYEIDTEQCITDVTQFLHQMQEEQFLSLIDN